MYTPETNMDTQKEMPWTTNLLLKMAHFFDIFWYLPAPSKGCQINPKGWLIDTPIYIYVGPGFYPDPIYIYIYVKFWGAFCFELPMSRQAAMLKCAPTSIFPFQILRAECCKESMTMAIGEKCWLRKILQL